MRKPEVCILPVAGLSTRNLPATKALHKGFLTLHSLPIIQYAVNACAEIGIKEVVFIYSDQSCKHLFESYFSPYPWLENHLREKNKLDLLKAVQEVIPAGMKFSFAEQAEPKGNGHAILMAKDIVGDRDFIVMWPDDVYINLHGDGVLKQLLDVYEKEGERRKKVIQYRHILPVEKMFTWTDCHHFLKGHYILMHSVIFRTRLLQECGLKLPEHTFYVDNLYVFEPLPYVKNMYYLDVNFYRYYIGRQDQSVNETVMISRIDQQIRVTKLMIDYLVGRKSELVKNRRLYQYMRNYLEIIMAVSSVLLIRSGTTEHLEKKKELWEYLKGKDKRLYLWMRNGIMGGTMNLPGRGGRKISVEGYKICQKLFGFN